MKPELSAFIIAAREYCNDEELSVLATLEALADKTPSWALFDRLAATTGKSKETIRWLLQRLCEQTSLTAVPILTEEEAAKQRASNRERNRRWRKSDAAKEKQKQDFNDA